jgi:hydroxymethylpyrimidine pyrophosphatase-like HAD family hydrolase
MIAVDLDGTLLNSRKRISEEDRAALLDAAARGVEIVPVTGRNYSTALPIVAELLAGGPLIASNGAIIRSREGETHHRGLLPASVAAKVLRITAEFRHYTVLTYDQQGEGQFRIEVPSNHSRHTGTETQRTFSPSKSFQESSGSNQGAVSATDSGDGSDHRAGNSPRHNQSAVATPPLSPMLPADGVAASPWIERYKAAVRFCDSLEREVTGGPGGDLGGDPVEIMFAGPVGSMREVEARLTRLTAEDAEENGVMRFRLLRTEYPERNFSIVDVIRHDCSKGHAVEFWSRYRGFAREEVMAIGDNYNDLEMLRFAGTPVVMGNAEEALKREGWAVTLDCDSGGVARAVERFVFGSGE